MLKRQELLAAIAEIEKLYVTHNTAKIPDAVNDAATIFSQAINIGSESSMIPDEHLPRVYEMLARIRAKYEDKLIEMGGVDAILHNLDMTITNLIDNLSSAENPDHEKIAQYKSSRNILQHERSAFHIDNNQAFRETQNLRELLACMWLLVSDEQAVLRPAYELNLLNIEDDAQRTIARNAIIQDAVLGFFLMLYEIRTAHNPQLSYLQSSQQPDNPSCISGSFGRLVLSSAPTHVLTTLTAQSVSFQTLEENALLIAQAQMQPINLSNLINEIEMFVDAEYKKSSTEIRMSIYRLICQYLLGEYSEDVLGIVATEQDNQNYLHFLDLLKFKFSFAVKQLLVAFPALKDANQLVLERIETTVYQPILTQLKTSFRNNWRDDTLEDKNFIELLRKRGVECIQQSAVNSLITQEQSIVDLRIKIHELYEQLCSNYEKMKLLIHKAVFFNFSRALTTINQQIPALITSCQNEIAHEFRGHFTALQEILNAKLADLATSVQQQTLMGLTLPSAWKDKAILTSQKFIMIESRVKQLENNLALINQANNPTACEFLSIIPYGRTGKSSGISDIDYAIEMVRILFSRLSNGEKRAEIELYSHRDSFDVFVHFSRQFISHAKDIAEKEHISWQSYRQAIKIMQSVFGAMRFDLLKHHALLDVQLIDDRLQQSIQMDLLKTRAFMAAKKSLFFATAEEKNELLEITPFDSTTHRQEWCAVAKLLYELDSTKALQTVQDYLLLTICCNLELVDLRFEEVDVLRTLCAVYLTDAYCESIMTIYKKTTENLTLELRLYALNVHISLMLTLLKPIHVLYGIGYVRIMDRALSNQLGERFSNADNGNNITILRTSFLEPGKLKSSQFRNSNCFHSSINAARQTEIYTVQELGRDFPIHFCSTSTLNPLLRNVPPILTLTNTNELGNCQRAIEVGFMEYSN